ncbi:MAG: transcription termination/antitermination protein NusA [Candidatus Omnitrophica bacterium CG11_big_fil_rev_8_21_14_0_20_42_13]|uniref:Transcription termination/antitermination protein NusA n=1 Tax=Candidatus Ghiorseimicrobium undicola TaxID=1974746 RepID=A0A2H0LWU0_9BACT|nr:MAG: transcription termination/antitermination protein NusA [Candidatus Omnitrophica bacterium CG11_big_fil_rev_8_21_14_0_20_42_13]
MNQEILSVLEYMEREKGINKDILIAAVEAALVSAAKKVIKVGPEQEIIVKLDKANGEISVFLDGKKVDSIDFGRIAAQTAKQVIIQKIREAEKEVVFQDFQSKLGDIVSGSVYRFERGNMVVDLLGRAEGFLPRSEQCPNEEFKQGDRLKAYVLEVKKEPRGPQIILSRAHPNFVKKLFELEIPEIYEGIVEIKSIARDAGERTKIAVWSKDEKVDCVGACVGMRGARVKNIVNELHNEKIDIVRFNEEPREYITGALSPAKIAQMKIDKVNKAVEVVVDDDQLSLAIGKRGQNVRLASRLTGYSIDIRTKAMLVEKAAQQAKPEVKAEVKEAEKVEITELSGIGEKTAKNLKKAGFTDVDAIAKTTAEELTKVDGIGKKTAEKIIKEAKKLIGK